MLCDKRPGGDQSVTGIATAYMDSIPIVAITCNVGVSLLGKDSFQEIDIAGITMPITKHNYIVKDVTKLADTIRKAFVIAKKGRPGRCSLTSRRMSQGQRQSTRGRSRRKWSRPARLTRQILIRP